MARPFSRESALASGYTPDQIRGRLRAGTWLRVSRGWYVAPESDLPLSAARCAANLARVDASDAVVSHTAAAQLFGLVVLGPPGQAVDLTLPPAAGRRTIQRRDLRISLAQLPARHVASREDVPVTSAARTVVDLGRRLPFADAVVVADSALRSGATTRSTLGDVLKDCNTWPGHRRACHVVAAADGRAESALESISRLVLRGSGVATPELQVLISDAYGAIGRVDFLWPAFRTVGEADGLAKYVDADVLRAEKLRQERLEDAGYEVVRWTWAQITSAPDAVVARVLRAFARSDARRTAA